MHGPQLTAPIASRCNGLSLAAVILLVLVLPIAGCSGDRRRSPSSPTLVVQPPAPAPPVPVRLRTIRGEVRDLDNTPLPHVTVKGAQGTATVTDNTGAFALPYPATFTGPQFVFTDSDQYESGGAGFSYGNEDVELRPIRLQQKVFLEFGHAPVTLGAAPDGPGAVDGGRIKQRLLYAVFENPLPGPAWAFREPAGDVDGGRGAAGLDLEPSAGCCDHCVGTPGAREITVRFSSPGESLVHVGFAETRSGPPSFQAFRFTLTPSSD